MDMFDFLTWEGSSGNGRLVACVADLGEAKSLTAIDDTGFRLETDMGRFEIEIRAYEPPFDMFGFVGVKLPSPVDGCNGALYFDPRITVALNYGWAYGCRKYCCGQRLELVDEESAWEALRRMPYDEWAAGIVGNAITWVDKCGNPITDLCDGIAELELKLWKLIQSPFPDEAELKLPWMQYIEHRNEKFLMSRFEHYSVVAKNLM